MNKLLLTVAFCIAIMTIMVQTAPAKYTTKYDNVNIDDILNNDRLVASYFKCLMETGKCTPEGEEIKRKYLSIFFKLAHRLSTDGENKLIS